MPFVWKKRTGRVLHSNRLVQVLVSLCLSTLTTFSYFPASLLCVLSSLALPYWADFHRKRCRRGALAFSLWICLLPSVNGPALLDSRCSLACRSRDFSYFTVFLRPKHQQNPRFDVSLRQLCCFQCVIQLEIERERWVLSTQLITWSEVNAFHASFCAP